MSQIKFGASSPPQPLAPGAYFTPDASFSRLSVPVRQDTLGAYVVLSAAAVSGLTLQQIADYAALAGLAATRTSTASLVSRPSILTVFSDRAAGVPPAAEVSAFDLAFLHALYWGETGFTSAQKSLAMAIQIQRDLYAPQVRAPKS